MAAFVFGQEVATIVGCNTSDVVACLRGKEVVDLFFNGKKWPNPDTHVIPPLAPAMPFGYVLC